MKHRTKKRFLKTLLLALGAALASTSVGCPAYGADDDWDDDSAFGDDDTAAGDDDDSASQ